MPKVGKKHFPYSKAGVKKAKEAAKKSGKKMTEDQEAYEGMAEKGMVGKKGLQKHMKSEAEMLEMFKKKAKKR